MMGAGAVDISAGRKVRGLVCTGCNLGCRTGHILVDRRLYCTRWCQGRVNVHGRCRLWILNDSGGGTGIVDGGQRKVQLRLRKKDLQHPYKNGNKGWQRY